jgi:hypothetical protein
MDCGSGLLLLMMRSIAKIEAGQVLLVHTEEPSAPPDPHDRTRLAGHEIRDSRAEHPARTVAGLGSARANTLAAGAARRGIRGRVRPRPSRAHRGAPRALQQLPLQPRLQLLLRRVLPRMRSRGCFLSTSP